MVAYLLMSTIQNLRVSYVIYFCRIDNDKVETYSITQSFNKQENWTKALKYTLCNLKWALYWFVGNTNFQPLSATVSLPSDVSAAGSLYAKRGPDSNKPSGKNLRNSWEIESWLISATCVNSFKHLCYKHRIIRRNTDAYNLLYSLSFFCVIITLLVR